MAGALGAHPSGAPVFAKSRLKPEVYTTTDGKIIIEEEFLHFLSVKML